jgi:hypothetical protein
MHHLGELALLGGLAFGAYELYHFERYGNFGIGNPYHHGIVFGGNNAQYGYGDQGYSNPSYGYHHGHQHHHHIY